MIQTLQNWMTARSDREKYLLATAIGLVFGFLAVYGIALPLYSATRAAEKDLQTAIERRGRITAMVQSAKTAQNDIIAPNAAGTGATNVEVLVRETAADAGIEFTDGSNVGQNGFSLRIENVRANALMLWLNRMSAENVAIATLSLQAKTGDMVSVTLQLRQDR